MYPTQSNNRSDDNMGTVSVPSTSLCLTLKVANGDIEYLTKRDWSRNNCYGNRTKGVILFPFLMHICGAKVWRALLQYFQRCRLFSINKFFTPLTPVPAVTGRYESRLFFHFWRHPFWPKLASSTLYTQLVQEENNFPMMPRSGWMARYAQKCSKSWVKNSVQNFLPLHLAAPS